MQKALIIGASQGVGLGIVKRLLEKGWEVTASVRKPTGTELHTFVDSLSADIASRLRIVQVDITKAEQILALKNELVNETFDLLLVNAGVALSPDSPVSEASVESFDWLMHTNVLGPLKTIEALDHLVRADGLIAATSSEMGSIVLNDNGVYALYRASKSALNQLMKSYSVKNPTRNVLIFSPGWVHTNLGSGTADAPLLPGQITVEESSKDIVAMLADLPKAAGFHFLNRKGGEIPF